MRDWIWVVEGGQRYFVHIVRYIAHNQTYTDTYIVQFANGDTRAYSGSDVFEWNQVRK